ncbi:unnamed protein product [Tuber melanosporum]|jgi:ribosomal protein L19|uniref:(Perigord truffle) hypothetical protein n=1 Tax=Tuber melanosporum (strain Mel28) TaxID=656061 RepID=D5GL32_TUBMM|nr:uncharacterized protein GSTUM_00009946001 [Tuber melanosporum]CAZ85225.1 unnamed protein product [Tuber melanosporum]
MASFWPLTTLLHHRTASTLSRTTTYTPAPRIHFATRQNPTLPRRRIKIYPPPPRPPTTDPISALTAAQIKALDPDGSRTELFSRRNPQAIRPGDIVYVRRKNGEPFSGVLLNIRRRGVDTSILLRDQLTKLGVEMWLKIYSPIIDSINLVQRKEKMARRAKLYYMRKPKHDFGPVRGIVSDWVRRSYAAKKGSVDKASQSAGQKGQKAKKAKTAKK